MWRTSFFLLLAFSFNGGSLNAGPLNEETLNTEKNNYPVDVQVNQAVVQVNGIVCSFCAYGAEKNLSKLEFLDKTQFGDNGVLVDIQTHRITLAIQAGRKIELAKIYNAIVKGGYDPIAVYLNLKGYIRTENHRIFLISSDTGQEFELINETLDLTSDSEAIRIIGKLNAKLIPSIKTGQPIPITVVEA